jgi:RNA polymerase sigma-70 factor (ECF subfamily)
MYRTDYLDNPPLKAPYICPICINNAIYKILFPFFEKIWNKLPTVTFSYYSHAGFYLNMHKFFGKSQRFKLLLNKHWEQMYRVSFSWCHDPELSADLVQESIEAALINQYKITDAEHLKKWLFTVLVNKWRDHCRKYRHHSDIDDVVLAHENTPETEHQNNESIKHLYKAMSLISVEQREVLSLVALEGFSYEEVASILDIPAGTVMSRLCRARKQLRELLNDTDELTTSETHIRRIK